MDEESSATDIESIPIALNNASIPIVFRDDHRQTSRCSRFKRLRPTPFFALVLFILMTSVECAASLIPLIRHEFGLIAMIASYIFLALVLFETLSAGIRCSTMDPGVIPRSYPVSVLFDAVVSENTAVIEKLIALGWAHYTADGTAIKICTTCNIVRPPNSTHCAICDNCVEGFDHHCEWLSNCIGKRNYSLFWFFLFQATVLLFSICFASVGVLSCATLALLSDKLTVIGATLDVLADHIDLVILAIVTFVVGGRIFLLLLFHAFLVVTSRTTKEYIRGVDETRKLSPVCCCPPGYISLNKNIQDTFR